MNIRPAIATDARAVATVHVDSISIDAREPVWAGVIERGSPEMWVLAENLRAIHFYTAAGFAPDAASTRNFARSGRTLREVRYETELGPS